MRLFGPLCVSISPVCLSVLLGGVSSCKVGFRCAPRTVSLSCRCYAGGVHGFVRSRVGYPVFGLCNSARVKCVLYRYRYKRVRLYSSLVRIRLVPFGGQASLFDLVMASLEGPFVPFIGCGAKSVMGTADDGGGYRYKLEAPAGVR